MARGGEEMEVKFYVADLQALEEKLESLDAELCHPRRLELNLRFDTPESELSGSQQVLRLRRYEDARVTYKGPSEFVQGARLRQEIEVSVGDFDSARNLLEALGYQVFFIYEKYRAVHCLGQVEISVDELPYGNFIEIEGPSADAIRTLADRLGLNWEARIPKSYTVLFQELKRKLDLPFQHLTFQNFEGRQIPVEALGVRPADKISSK